MMSILDQSILRAIATEGSVSDVNQLGYTDSQIAFGLKRLLNNGALIKRDGKFEIAGPFEFPDKKKKKWVNIGILEEFSIEKIKEEDQYEIGHRSFFRMYERVRH